MLLIFDQTLIALLKKQTIGCGGKKRQTRGEKIPQPVEILSSAKFDCLSTPETLDTKRSKCTDNEETEMFQVQGGVERGRQ